MARRLIHFPDIRARGIANNRVSLNDLIKNHNFPEGKRLSPNTIVWDEAEVEAWVDSLPSASAAKPPKKGAVKMLADPDPAAPKPKLKSGPNRRRAERKLEEVTTR
jgi:predicted DNA-binding transcriptional regulator AlpA